MATRDRVRRIWLVLVLAACPPRANPPGDFDLATPLGESTAPGPMVPITMCLLPDAAVVESGLLSRPVRTITPGPPVPAAPEEPAEPPPSPPPGVASPPPTNP
jgi:hypothetical protein